MTNKFLKKNKTLTERITSFISNPLCYQTYCKQIHIKKDHLKLFIFCNISKWWILLYFSGFRLIDKGIYLKTQKIFLAGFSIIPSVNFIVFNWMRCEMSKVFWGVPSFEGFNPLKASLYSRLFQVYSAAI